MHKICAIFNASVRQGHVLANGSIKDCTNPNRWKLANVVPVPMVHPPKDIRSDLRPISLTPTIVKKFESFVGAWILECIEDKLGRDQFGALKRRSTTHALIIMVHL